MKRLLLLMVVLIVGCTVHVHCKCESMAKWWIQEIPVIDLQEWNHPLPNLYLPDYGITHLPTLEGNYWAVPWVQKAK